MDPAKLRAARLEELSAMRKIGVWEGVDRAECEKRTGCAALNETKVSLGSVLRLASAQISEQVVCKDPSV